jgi:hypothetical protein
MLIAFYLPVLDNIDFLLSADCLKILDSLNYELKFCKAFLSSKPLHLRRSATW